MSKDATLHTDLPLNGPDKTTHTQMDQFSEFLYAPVRKLDADEYMANDLDGVTESATGSGNLNFLMMQAGQTDEEMSNHNPFDLPNNGEGFQFGPLANGASSNSLAGTGNNADTAMDRDFAPSHDLSEPVHAGGASNTNSTAGSLSASTLAANTQSVNPFSDVTNFATSSATDTSSIQPAINGLSGTNGTPGANGTDGTGGPVTTTITNITNLIDDGVLNTVENVYNTTTNLLTEITNNAGDILTTTINNAGDIITTTINNAGYIITTTVNDVTTIVNNITDNLPDLGPIGISLDTTLDNLTNVTLDIIHGDTITNVLNQTLDIAPVLTPVTDVLGDVVANLSLDAIIDPFHPDNSPNDFDVHVGTDVNLLGIAVPDLGLDIPLDPIEALVGDIDVGLDASDILLELPTLGGGSNGDLDLGLQGLEPLVDSGTLNGIAETIINPIENLTGDLDIGGAIGLGLLGTDADQGGTDTDIAIPMDIGLIDSPLLGDTLEISLDPVEDITGDIDLGLGVAANVLGDEAAPLFDSLPGGNGADDLLTQTGDLASGLAGDLLPSGDSADTDVSLETGIDLLDGGLLDNGGDLILDPVENLAGDIDVGASLGLDLLGTGGMDNGGADTDITVPIDIDFIDAPLPTDGLDIPLDPVESLTGDIDLDLGVTGNLLSDIDTLLNAIETTLNTTLDTALPLVESIIPNTGGLNLDALTSGIPGDSGALAPVTTWTETILPSAVESLGAGLASGPAAIIPDPVLAAPVTSLPAIPVIPVAPIITTGTGLFGGHGHHGGLFG